MGEETCIKLADRERHNLPAKLIGIGIYLEGGGFIVQKVLELLIRRSSC